MPELETTIHKSACRMCHGGCGVLVHIADGQIKKIVGDPDSPLNRGKICIKAPASIELVNHPDRLKFPMKRAGPRGSGKWDRIDWDEAYDILAERLGAIIDQDGARSIAIGTGTGRHHCDFVPRFANALGTPNWCEPGHAQCFFPRVNVSKMTFGDLPIGDYYGDTDPSCVLVWGHNPAVSGPDGELLFHCRALTKKNTKFIVVDPRRTLLAEEAQVWLQVRPGTDDAVALAMLHEIIAADLYDAEFVENWTYGFDQLKAHVEPYTPEWAASISWVPAEKIREAARLFASSKPAVVEWGCAIEHSPNSIQTARAIACLPALTGTIDIPGGWVFGSHILGDFPFLHDTLDDNVKAMRLGSDEFRLLGQANVMPSAHIPSVFEAMRTGKPYPIKAFLIFGNNPLATYANSTLVRDSLEKVEFLSVMDMFMTPSAELADLVLPAASWLELDALTAFPYFAETTALAQQKLAQVGECKQDEVVFAELARRMNLGAGKEDIETIFDGRLAPVGKSFRELTREGFAHKPITYRKHEKDGAGFKTESGKIELYSLALERLGYDALPTYREPPESPLSTPDVAEDYPLVLTSGARVLNFFTSEHRQLSRLRRSHPDPLVDLHPETAMEAGIREGDWVWIETRRGRIRQKANLTENIDPRVVHVEFGWWFPERQDREKGIWQSNANLLTDQGPPYDPAMGTYQLRALLCRISKAAAPH
ncbi:molybdopterin-dependent oxidoreductase [Hoeflea sp. TYP-13]|uniref:molybdopterin-dependent oxidoreductase n=1 Tax=Hoeflea sp. TYP-13 TaxID=3230023 RepID=UPI0034C649DE